MTVYCYFCGWEIGKVTFQNKEDIRQKYQDHIVSKHDFSEIAYYACWTTKEFRHEAIKRHKELYHDTLVNETLDNCELCQE